VSWDQRFFDPIVLSGRKLLVTLRNATQYTTKLPRAEHEWQAAVEALLLVAEHDGPTQFARIRDSESWRGINDRHPKTIGATILDGVASSRCR
jgi:hypothetical protein